MLLPAYLCCACRGALLANSLPPKTVAQEKVYMTLSPAGRDRAARPGSHDSERRQPLRHRFAPILRRQGRRASQSCAQASFLLGHPSLGTPNFWRRRVVAALHLELVSPPPVSQRTAGFPAPSCKLACLSHAALPVRLGTMKWSPLLPTPSLHSPTHQALLHLLKGAHRR